MAKTHIQNQFDVKNRNGEKFHSFFHEYSKINEQNVNIYCFELNTLSRRSCYLFAYFYYLCFVYFFHTGRDLKFKFKNYTKKGNDDYDVDRRKTEAKSFRKLIEKRCVSIVLWNVQRKFHINHKLKLFGRQTVNWKYEKAHKTSHIENDHFDDSLISFSLFGFKVTN